MGFKIGTESMKVMPICRGTPFFNNLLTIGTIAQSQTGNINPISAAHTTPINLLLGISLAVISSLIKIWISEDIKVPKIINGRDSKIILIKMVVKPCKDLLWIM